jgi:lambda family phage portal protein
MSRLERLVAYLSPEWAAKRAHARAYGAACDEAYEAARQTRLRRVSRNNGSGNAAVMLAGPKLRDEARRLERNHDLARGALNTLEQNVVGPQGIAVEPQPMTRAGEVHEDLAWRIKDLWDNWCLAPETTATFDWASAQRMLVRSWFRDGEVLMQHVAGPMASLDHGTTVPYSIELIEADLLDWDYTDPDRRILHGVERNAWGRAIGYHLFKQHPGDPGVYNVDRKRLPAELVRHLALRDRIGQVRGVSMFASVITRFADLKEYEESERIAAKVAASMAAFIRRGTPDMYSAEENDASGRRVDPPQHFVPGMVFELNAGEDIGTINTARPNPGLEPFRDGQLRAGAAGLRMSFSSLAKKYDGTYSAQRQELVEQWGAYALLSAEFAHQCVRPVFRRFIAAAQQSGELVVPREIDPSKVADALYIPQAMPWIDPQKEAQAWAELEKNHYVAAQEVIRRRGGNPRDVLKQQESWRRQLRDHGLTSSTEGSPDEKRDDVPDPADDPGADDRVRRDGGRRAA